MSGARIDQLRPAVLAAGVSAVLAGLALVGTPALAAGTFGVQVVVALAWLAALDARGSQGAFLLVVAASIAGDIAVAVHHAAALGETAPVAGIAVVASFLHQLTRRPRTGVTRSLAATLSGVALVLCASAFIALVRERTGEQAAAAALIGVGGGLLVARLADLVVARPSVFAGSRRGLVGVVLGCAAAAALGGLYGSASGTLRTAVGLRMGLIAALLALIADIAVDLVLTQAPPDDERPLSALTPLSVLLPVVLAAPVAYLAGRILLT